MREDSHAYDDLLEMSHPVSKRHPPMDLTARAAQFMPFAALTGYESAILETARITDERLELDEEQQLEIGETLYRLSGMISGRREDRPEITVTWFQADEKKEGGQAVTRTERVRRVDTAESRLILADGTAIAFGDLYGIRIREDGKNVSPQKVPAEKEE